MKHTHYLRPRNGIDMSYAENGTHTRNLYWEAFRRWPSSIEWTIHNPENPEQLESLLEVMGFTVEIIILKNPGKAIDSSYEDKYIKVFVHRADRIVISNSSNADRMHLHMHFQVEYFDYALQIHKFINERVGSTGPVAGRINLLSMEAGDFMLVGLSIPKPVIDLTLSYGESFAAIDKQIQEFLVGKESGLVLLHGVSGSGKSTYIYNLIHQCQQKMIFIPNNIVASIGNPDFISFLLGNAKNAVIIVEDAEKVLLKRGGAGDAGVSTLLNITDGILGKVLGCKVICTFNIERSELDDALLRKGRLRTEHVFNKLSPREANKLFEFLGKERRTTEPLVLADIYNDEGGREITTSTVGFKHETLDTR